jgi:hypothetical protein
MRFEHDWSAVVADRRKRASPRSPSVICDFAVLNKVEMLPWDVWALNGNAAQRSTAQSLLTSTG